MIAKLKFKTMILVMSLLEMKKDNTIVKRMFRFLNMNVLKKNLAHIWKKYQQMYKDKYIEESLNHWEDEPEEFDEEIPEEYYETIIETGFYIYFLIRHYLELDLFDADIDQKLEMEEFKKEIELMKEQKSIFKQSLFGQLCGLAADLASAGKKLGETALFFKGGKKSQAEEAAENKMLAKQAVKFFSQKSSSIEIIRDSQLVKVLFIKMPYCECLPKDMKTEFHQEVHQQGANVKSKVSELITRKNQFKETAKYELWLTQQYSKSCILSLFAKNLELWENLCFYLTVTLNFFIVSSYYGDHWDHRMNQPQLFRKYSIQQTHDIIFFIGYCMIVSSCIVVTFFLFKKAPIIVQEAWELTSAIKIKGFIGKLVITLFKIAFVLVKLVFTVKILYQLAYVFFAFMGIYFHPFCFAFHLSEIIIRYETLKPVIYTIGQAYFALAMTLLFFLMIIYWFSVVGFRFFHEQYMFNNQLNALEISSDQLAVLGDHTDFCRSMLQCFIVTFDQTLKANSGVGGWLYMNPKILDVPFVTNSTSDTLHTYFSFPRWIFDNLSNFIICIIVLQILSGIIIDTFQELTQESADKKEQMVGKCFMCGIKSKVFDQQVGKDNTFLSHIKIDHHMWNYIFFLAYLHDKDKTEYTGIEDYIYALVEEHNEKWIPFHRSLTLEMSLLAGDEIEQSKETIDEITDEIHDIQKSIKNLNNVIERLKQQHIQEYNNMM